MFTHAACAPAGKNLLPVPVSSSCFCLSPSFIESHELEISMRKQRVNDMNRSLYCLCMAFFFSVHCRRLGELLESMTRYFAATEYRNEKKRAREVWRSIKTDKEIEAKACLSVYTYGTKPNGNLLLTFSFLLFFFRLFSFLSLLVCTFRCDSFVRMIRSHTNNHFFFYMHNARATCTQRDSQTYLKVGKIYFVFKRFVYRAQEHIVSR